MALASFELLIDTVYSISTPIRLLRCYCFSLNIAVSIAIPMACLTNQVCEAGSSFLETSTCYSYSFEGDLLDQD